MGRLLTEVFELPSDIPTNGKTYQKPPLTQRRSSISHAYTPSVRSNRIMLSSNNRNFSSHIRTLGYSGIIFDESTDFNVEDWDLFPYLRARFIHSGNDYSLSTSIDDDDNETNSDDDDDDDDDDDNDEEVLDDYDCDSHHSSDRSGKHRNVIYRCPDCQTDIAHSSSVMSRDFWGSHGKAFLVSSVLNVSLDSLETRQMRTGSFGVKTIHCVQCNRDLGWKYCVSELSREQYKIGKYVIEKNIMTEFSIH